MYNASLRNKWDAESIRSSQEELLKRGREKAMAEGRAEGEAKGKAEGKAEVIKNLLSLNKFSISEIAELSNVTVEFVNGVQAEIAKGK